MLGALVLDTGLCETGVTGLFTIVLMDCAPQTIVEAHPESSDSHGDGSLVEQFFLRM